METTFISIHDLSLDARLLYVSTSIEDILGYSPQEVIGKSCWEYFHPDEIPFAQAIHGRSIQLDKAAVLNYCQVKNNQGRWIGCECVFTIVHDVLVAATSIYKRGMKSHKRAKEAPVIRRLFSSSPRDPRYHMLQYISAKFSQKIPTQVHEPRAALFLNRFSRTLTIMYATNGLAELLGISADQLTGKSFYYCIQENCLREAVKCLESAKANDSIAYLRFWFRDPRQDDQLDHDERMSDGHSSGDEDDGGVHLAEPMDHDSSEHAVNSDSSNSLRSSAERDSGRSRNAHSLDPNSRSSSDNSTNGNNQDAIFDPPEGVQSRTSSISTTEDSYPQRDAWIPSNPHIELEAVVSCTSDGLVVVIRAARPFVPQISETTSQSTKHPYANGLFASPWANEPIFPDMQHRANPLPHSSQPAQFPINPTAEQANTAAAKGPPTEDFMNSIKEVAVFAWALTGINGSLAQYGRGTPAGESQPQSGLPVWDPHSTPGHAADPYAGYGDAGMSYDHVNGTPNWMSGPQNQLTGYQGCAPPHVNSGSGFIDDRINYENQGSSFVGGTESYEQMNDFDMSAQAHSQTNGVSFDAHAQPMPVKSICFDDSIRENQPDGQYQSGGYNHDSYTNGYSNSAPPNGSWDYQPQHERIWDSPSATNQVASGYGQAGNRTRFS